MSQFVQEAVKEPRSEAIVSDPLNHIDLKSFVRYDASIAADFVLQDLYFRLFASGDLDLLVHPSAKSIGGFFSLVRAAIPCVYILNNEGKIWYIAWYEPCFSGAFFSMWVDPAMRGTHAHLEAVCITYREIGFKLYPVLMGITKQGNLLLLHQKLGYQTTARIPKLWDGADCWLLTLDQVDFEQSRLYKAYKRLTLRKPTEI